MLKKSLAIILSTALALGILVQGSFAFGTWGSSGDWKTITNASLTTVETIETDIQTYNYQYAFLAENVQGNTFHLYLSDYPMRLCTQSSYGIEIPNSSAKCCRYIINSSGAITGSTLRTSPDYTINNSFGTWYYYFRDTFSVGTTGTGWASYDFEVDVNYRFPNPTTYSANLSGFPWEDTRFLDAYISGSTYGNVRYLCVDVDDIVISSTWISVRFTDQFGPGTYIQDYPFDFFTANGHSYIKIMPDLISDYEFTVTSVLYSGSSSWGVKEITGLDLKFNEDLFPSPIPSVVPVPDYSYYDTTYINYNGGNPEVIYTPISSELEIGFIGSDTSKYYFLDKFPYLYLRQPFSYTFIVIPDIQYEYSSFLSDSIYQYDVVIDDFEITNDNYYQVYSFDYIYGSGSWANLSAALTAAQVLDVSSVLDSWYSSHEPVVYQYPYSTDEAFSFDDRVYDCSLIITDSFYFKQTNYLLGDTGDILSEFSERFFKIDGFSDSLFDNISSLYNLNLQYYDSSLQALTGLSYWLNDNDISSNLSDIANLLSSVDNYLSSVDGKLNYLVTIDSDLNDLLEWFQNQEDSDVTLTLPDFNPSILIDYYGENIGDFVEFVQSFVNTLPDFDYSDFPNFFDYAADLVDDTAGSGDDLIGSLFQPYDYDDSGLQEFGWD